MHAWIKRLQVQNTKPSYNNKKHITKYHIVFSQLNLVFQFSPHLHPSYPQLLPSILLYLCGRNQLNSSSSSSKTFNLVLLLRDFDCCYLLTSSSPFEACSSVAHDDEKADGGDDDRRRHAEAEVAPEGEVVPEELRAPRLLADDQVRG